MNFLFAPEPSGMPDARGWPADDRPCETIQCQGALPDRFASLAMKLMIRLKLIPLWRWTAEAPHSKPSVNPDCR